MRKYFLAIFILTYNLIHASSVAWSAYSLWDNGSGNPRYGYIDYLQISAACSFIDIKVTTSSGSATINATGGYAETCCAWALSCAGDILDESYFNALDSFFYKRNIQNDSTIHKDYGIDISKGHDIYLAVMVTDYRHPDSDYNYGWVQIGMNEDGRIYAIDSALGLNGQAIIVGGGSATPEPNSVLLLIIGIGVLSLIRPTPQFSHPG